MTREKLMELLGVEAGGEFEAENKDDLKLLLHYMTKRNYKDVIFKSDYKESDHGEVILRVGFGEMDLYVLSE